MSVIFENLIEAALLSSVLILVVLLLRAIFNKKLNIKILSFLWVLVLLRLILPITFNSPIRIINHSNNLNKIESTTENVENEPKNILNEYNENATVEEYANVDGEAAISSNNSQDFSQNGSEIVKIKDFLTVDYIKNVIVIVWLCGVIIMFGINIKRVYVFRNKINSGSLINNPQIREIIKDNKDKLKIKCSIKIYECDYIDSPIIYGILNPKILLPVGYTDSISSDKLSLIIMHELCHVKNMDLIKNYLWLFSRIIYWFNPLIVVAYKAYLEDIELYCDEIVLKNLSRNKRFEYSQTLLDVIKLSNGEMHLPIALSFCKDKTKIRKRVENMIRPTKKLRTASYITIFIVIMMIFVCFTTACLPNTITVSKFIANQITDQTIEENRETIFNQIDEMNNHFEFEAQGNDGVKIVADAEIITPDLDNVPFIKVTPENISKEQFHAFIDHVLGDRPIYMYNTMEEYDGNLIASPSSPCHSTETTLKTHVVEDHWAYIELCQSLDGLDTQFTYWRYDDGKAWSDFEPYTGEEKSYEDYLQNAMDLIAVIDGKNSNLTLSDTWISTEENKSFCYRFFFDRDYSETKVKSVSRLSKDSFEESNHEISPEILQIFVDDEGIFEVWWNDYKKDYEIIENNLLLADFDTIIKTFKENCSNDFWWIPNEEHVPDDATATINIEKVELNYMFVYDEDTENYYIMPVWDFIGDMTYDQVFTYGGDDSPVDEGLKDVSVFTVNAVDGTIIYRYLGY